MFELYKKEIATFFGSATGYLVVGVFLLLTWLLLWVIPSDFNIIYGGYATLTPLFDIAPWIYLFLVPAIAMRLIADERRAGTIELLLIRPLQPWRIVMAKYLAGFSLVCLSILPTLVYVTVVCALGSPQGNIDMGGTIGSYIALLFLAATYMAVGIFASSITDNQIVAFVTGAALCALLYVGCDMISSLAPQSDWAAFTMDLGIAQHYSSISRGVVDSRDVIYFLAVCVIFLTLTSALISRSSGRFRRPLICVVVCLTVVPFLSSLTHFRADLTSEGRYTLSPVTRSYADSLKATVIVNLYLDGDLNPGFRRLRRQAVDICQEINSCSSKGIRLISTDPAELKPDAAKSFAQELERAGLAGVPVFETKEDGQKTRSIVYPYARVQLSDKSVWVSLLENVPGLSGEESLNRSVEGIEYKFTDAISRLTRTEVPKVAFLEGHGELDELDVNGATEALAQHFDVDRGQIGSDPSILNPYKVLIIAKPTQRFPEKDKYAIDQYIMRGGRVLWLIDAINMTLDSLRQSSQTVGIPSDLNLSDQLFVYGVRIRQSVIEDMSCGMIPISVPTRDGQTSIVPMPWLFGPLMATNMLSPVTRNVSFVHGDFASPIDTVGEELPLVRTPLLRSSAMTRVSEVPVVARLSTIHQEPRPEDFPQRYLTMALLEEGSFRSLFSHRPIPQGVTAKSGKRSEMSVPTKMIFVGDGDVIRNDVRFRHSSNPTIVPLGYDDITRQTYGNKDFIVNAVQYLADDDGLMVLRNRTFSLRLLDRQLIAAGTTGYKVVALFFPLVLVAAIGIVVTLLRRRLFARHPKSE